MLFIFVMFACLSLGHSQGPYKYNGPDVTIPQQQQLPRQQVVVVQHQPQQQPQFAVQPLQQHQQQLPQQHVVVQHQQQHQTPQHVVQPLPQQQVQPQQPIKYYVVQTLGPQGRAYELQVQKSQAIYVKQQAENVPGNHLTYVAQPKQQLQQYYLTTQQHQPQSGRTNPLLINVQHHPQSSPASQGSPAQDLTPPKPKPSSTATAINPQPYAVVQLPSGQRTQDGGHGSGAPQSTTAVIPAHDHPVGGRVGDYNSQSQTSQLDSYYYKQAVSGDGRAYQRFVTTCQPNGKCQPLKLTRGQTEPAHQQLLMAARAKTYAAQDPCASSKAVAVASSSSSSDVSQKASSYYRGGAAAAIAASYTPPGAIRNAAGQMRPRDRRTSAYREQTLFRYPYN